MVAFLTIAPIRAGHVLVVPREEVDHWDDVDSVDRARLFEVSHTITKALKVCFPSERVGLMIAGLEVPHTHIHLMPIDSMGDMDFSQAKQAEADELALHADMLRCELQAMGEVHADCV